MKFKNYIETESGIKDTSSEPGTAGQVLSSTGTGTSWIDQNTLVSAASKLVVISCKNTSGSTINKGTPVYQTGTVGATDVIEVAPADAEISTGSLPAIGILQTTLINNNDPVTDPGNVVITGEFLNYSTSGIPTNNPGGVPITGDTVYLAAGGGLTCIKPTGPGNAIQNLGLIGKVSGGSAGSITVSSIMRANDVPNLPEGRIWIGDGNTIVSDTVYVDEPNGRVGIGTDNPATPLHVYGTIDGEPTTMLVENGDTTITLGQLVANLEFRANDASVNGVGAMGQLAMVAENNGSVYGMGLYTKDGTPGVNEVMRLSGYGNVGIGTTNPQSQIGSTKILDISSNGNGEVILDHTDAGATSDIGLYSWNRNNDHLAHIKATCDGATDAAFISFHTQAAGGSFFNPSSNEKMRIESSGNVGIGTTSPNHKLEVAGEVQIKNGNFSYLYLHNTSNFLYGDAFGNTIIRSADNFRIQTKTGGGESVRVTSAGNVGIGTNDPADKLEVAAANSQLRLRDTDDNNFTQFSYSSGKLVVRNNSTTTTVNQFTLDSIGRMGIGTTSPAKKLTIGNIGASNTDGLKIEDPSNTAYGAHYSYNDASTTVEIGGVVNNSLRDCISIARDATRTITINTSENVGIGTTNPQAKLHVANGLLRTWAPTSGTSAIFESTVSNRNFVTITAANEAELWFGNATTQAKGRIRYEMATNNMEFWTNATQKMVIESNGDVGIGTTSPNAKLEVNGSTRITGAGLDVGYGNNGTNYVQVGYGRTTNGFALLDLIGDSTYTDYGFRILRNNGGPNTDTDIIHRGTGDLDLKTVEAGDIGFHTTSIQRMIVKSDGDVGIGTTNPSQKLHVVGRVASTAGNGFEIINSYGSPRLSDFYGSFMTTGPLYVGGSYSGSAQPCNASAFNITSDYRLKENEAPLTEASSRIKKLKPIRFNYISSENTVDGFLAHEVAEVVPEAVTGEKDAVREDGSDELQGLDLSKIVPLLTAALQESITKIEQLEQRIQTLENK